MTSGLPLFLVDADGVLNPYAAPACPPGYIEYEFFPGEAHFFRVVQRETPQSSACYVQQGRIVADRACDRSRGIASRPLPQLPDCLNVR
ncbi:MAG: hypothetical protein JO345_07205 [Streptosporangiaceae bacterium]|nr:hypothetical protein [Streptosporangiaceae bacterium]